MGEINLSNSGGRDAVVATSNVVSIKQIRWLDDQSRQASSIRFVKSTIPHDVDALLVEHGDLDNLSRALIDGDPEIDLENTGRFLSDTSRVYIDEDAASSATCGSWKSSRTPTAAFATSGLARWPTRILSTDTPLRWSGVFIPKEDAIRKFVFSGKAQLQHVNGLTFDFLYAMAKELEERNSLMLLGAGAKSNQPLILRRGGTPYRGFLEGRTDGDRYCLILHFSNLELKLPKNGEASE